MDKPTKNKPATQYEIQEALDWKLDRSQSLRQAIVDQAEKDLSVTHLIGQIDVTVDGDYFLATFTEVKL